MPPLAFTAIEAHADGNDKSNKKKDKGKNKKKDRNQGQVNGPVTVNAAGGDAAASAQTVVQTNNQVCAGDCAQSSQQVADTSLNQAALASSPITALRPSTYWIDLACTFDAPNYRTVCTGATQGHAPGPEDQPAARWLLRRRAQDRVAARTPGDGAGPDALCQPACGPLRGAARRHDLAPRGA